MNYKQDIERITKNEYSVLEKYINSRTKILFIHNICHNTFLMKPNDFQQGHRCPLCSNKSRGKQNIKKTYRENYSKIIKEKTMNEYSVVSEYINSRTKVKFKHNTCGSEFLMKPNDFQQGHRCPICNQKSKGENKIEEFLNKNNIIFEKEKIFEECKNIRKLPFDFYIPEKNILIEYDGEQHFKENSFNHSKEKYKRIIINDNLKNKFAKENLIKLVRIPYTEFKNIERILTENLIE